MAPVAHPPIVRAVLAHLPELEAAFRRLALHVEIARSYSTGSGRPVVTLRFTCDEQSDQLLEDERRVLQEARDAFIFAGFVARFGGDRRLILDGYHGRQIAAAA